MTNKNEKNAVNIQDRILGSIRKVGKGKTLAKHLTQAEAQDAFDLLLDGQFTPVQVGAFLQALRIQELTLEEMVGMCQAFLAHSKIQPLPTEPRITLNLASDTGRKGGLALLLAADKMAQLGFPFGVLRSEPVLSKNSLPFEGTLSLCQPEKAKAPLLFVEANHFIEGLSDLSALRSQLGFRSALHTMEKLLNPWPESLLLLGISHRHYAERMGATLASLGRSGLVILGNHGTPDLNLHKATEWLRVDSAGNIHWESLDPNDLGLQLDASIFSLARFPEWKTMLDEGMHSPLGSIMIYHLAFLGIVLGETEKGPQARVWAEQGLARLHG